MRLVYFSPVPAASYAQRPHFAVQAWLELGIEAVLWVEPYPSRLPKLADLRRRPGQRNQGTQLDQRIEVLPVQALPVEPLPGGTTLNRWMFWPAAWRRLASFCRSPWIAAVGRPSQLALQALRQLRPQASLYDCMDNFPEFHRGLSRWAMRRAEDALARQVDWVAASSTFLADKFRRRGLPVTLVPNACATEMFTPARRAGDTVLGYVGCLGPWFDWPLVLRLAQAMPDCQIELIGPVEAAVPRLPDNIAIRPPCPHSEVPGHLARFSAGLLPFALNSLTAGVDPIKFYEYRAAGLPVLSTRFGEMSWRDEADGVYFLDRASDLSAVTTKALASRMSEDQRQRFCHENDWARRFLRPGPLRTLLTQPAHRPAGPSWLDARSSAGATQRRSARRN